MDKLKKRIEILEAELEAIVAIEEDSSAAYRAAKLIALDALKWKS